MKNVIRLVLVQTFLMVMSAGCRSTLDGESSDLAGARNVLYRCQSRNTGVAFELDKPLQKNFFPIGKRILVTSRGDTKSSAEFKVTQFSQVDAEISLSLEPVGQNTLGESINIEGNEKSFKIEYNHGMHRDESADGKCTRK